ncbi:MAG TPA: ABC transporter permease, partial [Candidatus Limiplasma sp.]|nr:ABC transporter permease [Candidatus Limiplasma sp.]
KITELDDVTGVTPTVSATITVARNGEYESDISLSGKNDYYFSTTDAVSRGRAFNPIDINTMARVCLIDQDMVDEFFYGVDPIGETIYLNNLSFTVVGILADSSGESITEMVSGTSDIYAPYTTVMKLNDATLVTSITVYVDSAAKSDTVKTEVGDYLDSLFSYEDDTYTITTMDSIQETMDSMLSMMSALLGGIASISLIVGGIGIMNMMLTSVTERTVEIGLKKAIGAEPGQIQIEFLIEAFLLSMIGGVIGVVLGIALSAILCHVMGTTFTISYGAIALGVGFSAAVGILFGWSPARKASNLNPIDALRRM